MEKYIPAMAKIQTGYGRRWIAVTLTGYRVPRDAVGVNVDIFAKMARKFLKGRFLGGLIVVEHTWKPYSKEYYIHAHGFCLGDFQNQVQLEYEWGSYLLEEGVISFEEFHKARDDAHKQMPEKGYDKVDGIRFCWLQDFRWEPHGGMRTNSEAILAGLTYILKYVSKGVALEDEDLQQVKGMRYISTFGELYGMVLPVIKSICKFCKGNVGLCYSQDIEMIEARKLKGEYPEHDEPLELERVITWPAKRRSEPYDVVKRRYDDLKAWMEGVLTKFTPKIVAVLYRCATCGAECQSEMGSEKWLATHSNPPHKLA